MNLRVTQTAKISQENRCENGCVNGIDAYLGSYGESIEYWFCECVIRRTGIHNRQLTTNVS